MSGFVSVRDAYHLWRQVFWSQCIAAALVTGFTLLGFIWGALVPLGAWIYLERPRRRYRALFWNQALALHSSKVQGEPEIYAFMSKRHQREHARLAVERFLRKDERR